ncbi:hypothetical protein FRC06_007023 [Ceratobasidium sp. 370]|nr:hypothetical protein FRC06_007023 [Ceratobasidium sp. 370]
MSSKPRLSKRESSSALRQDATSPPSGRKRSGSVASTASRASLMFTNPAKHFGLTRKASTATLSAAPISASVSVMEHALDTTPASAGTSGSAMRGSVFDRLRPVRQATRAEDALRSVQSRGPQAPIPPSEPELAPLSESPSSKPIPLPRANDTLEIPMLSTSPAGSENLGALSSTPPKPKFATPLLTVGSRTSSPAPSIMNKDTNATAPLPSPVPSTPPVSSSPPTQPKFRTPSLTPEFGASRLARKSSMSSIRSNDPTNNKRSVSPSPLSLHSTTPPQAPTPTLSAPPPTPAFLSVPGTGSSSSPNPNSSNIDTHMGGASPPAAGSSWLAAIRGMGRSPTPAPTPSAIEDTLRTPAEPKSGTDDTALPVNQPSDDSVTTPSTPQLTTPSSAGTIRPAQDEPEAGNKDVATPVVVQDAVVLVSPASAVGSSIGVGQDAHTLTINTIAAQHSAGIGAAAGYSPAGWLAWLTSTPSSRSGSPTLARMGRRQIKDEAEDMVMYIDSEGEEGDGEETDGDAMTEDNGLTPALTPPAVDTAIEERHKGASGWSWGTSRDNGKGKAKASEQTDETAKRPGMGVTALSVDSVVPVPSEGEGENGEYLRNFFFFSFLFFFVILYFGLALGSAPSWIYAGFPRGLVVHLDLHRLFPLAFWSCATLRIRHCFGTRSHLGLRMRFTFQLRTTRLSQVV